MATFVLSGSVVRSDGAAGNLPTMDLHYEFRIGNRLSSYSKSALLQTSENDS